MGSKIKEREKELFEASYKITRWLIVQPEYIKAFEQYAKKSNSKMLAVKDIEDIKKIWGFFPLFPPYDVYGNTPFLRYFRNTFGGGNYINPVRVLNQKKLLSTWLWNGNYHHVNSPAVVQVEINPAQSDEQIIHSLKIVLKNIRKAYSVKVIKPSISSFAELLMKAQILKRLRIKNKAIKKRLMNERQFKSNQVDSKESFRKTLEAVLALI